MPATILGAVLWKRKPTSRPRPIMTASEKTLRLRSATVRPARTAARDIGRLRKRSIIPLFMSSARPIEVVMPPIRTASTKIAGTTKST
jgi:hypothetical protein